MAASSAVSSDVNDGPVLSVINKRLRALRKKHNRILQMEESVSQGKSLNKEQEETLRSKPYVIAGIDELEKLKQPLSVALSEEINAALLHNQQQSRDNSHTVTEDTTDNSNYSKEDEEEEEEEENEPEKPERAEKEDRGEAQGENGDFNVEEDLLKLLYFGSMFDVKSQNDFTSTMLTRTHERGCCLTYDYVTDDDADAADLLVERDLDLISMVGGLLISRPMNSSLSHKNALLHCVQHAKLWLARSRQPIEPDSNITYASLREKLNKIMASDYFTTPPEMKAPVEVAAAAGSYGSFQVPVHVNEPVQVEGSPAQYEQKEQETVNAQGNEYFENQSIPVEEYHQGEEVEIEHSYQESDKGQQYAPRRSYQNHRGNRGVSGGGRRGYSNGRGGRGSSRGGAYPNGRSQYYDQPGQYYPRNNYYRGRGGRGGGGNHTYQVGQGGYLLGES